MSLDLINGKIQVKQLELNLEKTSEKRTLIMNQLEILKNFKKIEELRMKIERLRASK